MMRWMTAICALVTMTGAARAAGALPQVESYDFGAKRMEWVARELKKEPAYKSEKVRYSIWVLGDGRKSVMTMAWDESGGTGTGYDTLYVDRNFNGDLTEEGALTELWPRIRSDLKDKGLAARRRTETSFSWPAIYPQFMAMYRQVLGEESPE